MISRRNLLLCASLAVTPSTAWGAPARPPMAIYKTASCGCCEGWVAHARRAGFRPSVHVVEEVATLNRKHGVPFELSSCHLATVGGYVVVGHVPMPDVVRLLKEKPAATGLTVPGMPFGSPGMETPDNQREAFATLLLLRGGGTRVFARHS